MNYILFLPKINFFFLNLPSEIDGMLYKAVRHSIVKKYTVKIDHKKHLKWFKIWFMLAKHLSFAWEMAHGLIINFLWYVVWNRARLHEISYKEKKEIVKVFFFSLSLVKGKERHREWGIERIFINFFIYYILAV